MTSYVFDQGKIVPESSVNLSFRVKAFNYGLALIDGIRAYWNPQQQQLYVFRLRDHLVRFQQAIRTVQLAIPFDVETMRHAVLELLRYHRFRQNVYIRPIAYRGEEGLLPDFAGSKDRLLIYCITQGIEPTQAVYTARVSSWTRVSSEAIPSWLKIAGAYVNSALSYTEVAQEGADRAILLTPEGNVSEGATENLFMFRRGQLVTPPPSDDIFEGITRDTVMQLAAREWCAPVVERSIPRIELYSADEIFLTGTLTQIRGVTTLDGRRVGTGKEGVVTAQFQQMYSRIVYGEDHRYAYWLTPVYG
jgi:branched-chain amino acid aminotransferase